jgi:hypothetical protein
MLHNQPEYLSDYVLSFHDWLTYLQTYTPCATWSVNLPTTFLPICPQPTYLPIQMWCATQARNCHPDIISYLIHEFDCERSLWLHVAKWRWYNQYIHCNFCSAYYVVLALAMSADTCSLTSSLLAYRLHSRCYAKHMSLSGINIQSWSEPEFEFQVAVLVHNRRLVFSQIRFGTRRASYTYLWTVVKLQNI